METTITHEIRKISLPEKQYIVKRATVPFDKLTTFFSQTYDELYKLVQRLGIEAKEPPCAIYYSVDEPGMKTDVAAAIPVSGKLPDVGDFDVTIVPKGQAITTLYVGPYDKMMYVYNELEAYMKNNGLTRDLVVEEYLTDPTAEKDPENWKTNIYYTLKN